MPALRLFACVACVLLSGCGMRVPDIQDVGGRPEGQRFVQAVLTNITCELRAALNDLHQTFPKGTFIDKWGVQTTLTLTYDEDGALATNVLWKPPSPATSIFSLGAGLNFSSDATRINRINAYYLVSDLDRAKCSDEARPHGPFLLQSDLKLSEWLFDAVSASMTNTINFTNTSLAVSQNVIQHEVKFQIVTGGTLNPSWVLTRLTVNGPFASANRRRTNDLLITFAPAVPAVVTASKGQASDLAVASQPIRQGADLHLSAAIAAGFETALKNNGMR